ncbi:calponin [Boeremia exigua]|uniref:calponin n=1 Tax=Boeremia exigua TaxID=749465 RepID=UPI001E8D0CB8|nr:calponin [Boeremia exigua]KAH6633303.1 calponin [Boeremia exigua]
MASVTSLDQDMKSLRLGRYTPQAAAELRAWIEAALGEPLPAGDLLDALKDGTALCRLANLALPAPVRFKRSAMPFIQMENIAHFLKACELPPLSLPSHDRFLTVDLYESKDPAQVLQCLAAFSRAAHRLNPAAFATSIGPKRAAGSPTTPARPDFSRSVGSSTFNPLKPPHARPPPLSPARTGGSTASRTSTGTPASPPAGVTSWSKKADQGVTSPAWNIHQYGYMGGASQGNQGIAFGARRQITTAGPHVPNMAEKERQRKAKAEEEERLRVAAEEAETHRRVEREAEEERQRAEEERLWEEESRKQREAKERRLEEQKRSWEEQERQWKSQEEARQKEEREAQAAAEQEARRKRAGSDARLRGQFLSQYQAEQRSRPSSQADDHSDRIVELERQLEEAKERERQYQAERENRKQRTRSKSRSRPEPPPRAPSPQESNVSWAQADDRAYLRDAWEANHREPARPLPETFSSSTSSTSSRPLPDPAAYMKASQPPPSRTDRFLSSNPAPVPAKPTTFTPQESTSTNEQRAEDARRAARQQSTKDAGWASKSLLEREMERERERQREWETAQREIAEAAVDPTAGPKEGQSWDVNQYGYMGGDSQNRGGISFGGKRQILGPRPFGPR